MPKAAITPKPNKSPMRESGIVRLPAPIVKVAAPQVTVKVDAPQVSIDAGEFTAAIKALTGQINTALNGIAHAMAAHDKRLTEVAAEQQKLLKAIAENKPIVQMPARPSSFYVELDKEDGETVGMRIAAGDRLN